MTPRKSHPNRQDSASKIDKKRKLSNKINAEKELDKTLSDTFPASDATAKY